MDSLHPVKPCLLSQPETSVTCSHRFGYCGSERPAANSSVGRGASRFRAVKTRKSYKKVRGGYSPRGRFMPWSWVTVRQSCSIVFCASLLAARTLAQEPQEQLVNLKYEVDPALQGCPNAVEFRAIVAQQLGYDPYGPDAPLGVNVRVRATESGLEGTIDWSAADANKLGQRRFTSRNEDCREMMMTVGFVVAVQIQLMATEKAKTSPPHSENEPSSRSQEEPAKSSQELVRSVTLTIRSFEVHAASSDSTKWTASAGLGSSLAFGVAPHTVAQGRLFLALQRGWVGLEAGAEASLPSTHREAYGGGYRYEQLLGTLAACGYAGTFSVCGVGKLGQIHVRGTGVDKPASSSGFLAQVGPRLGYSLGLGNHLALLGQVEALYSLTPWTVDLNQVTVWTMPRLGAVAGIDLTARFR